jgi:hypothetical protein
MMLNLPALLAAMASTIAMYKMGKMNRRKLWARVVFWSVAIVAVAAGFPIYNAVVGRPIFEIYEVSLLEIVLVTAVVYLIFIVSWQMTRLETVEKTVRDLCSSISIELSDRRKKGRDA